MGFVRERLAAHRLVGVGHRVVHGGLEFAAPVRVDAATVDTLEKYVPLAPLHQPHNLAPIRLLLERLPGLPQVACFDTAFHRGQPPVAQAFALPKSDHRPRRDSLRLPWPVVRIRGERAARTRRARGGGQSASCCTSATDRACARSPAGAASQARWASPRRTACRWARAAAASILGVVLYMMDELKMDARAIERMIYQESGLLGVSGISSDMRTLEASADPGAGSGDRPVRLSDRARARFAGGRASWPRRDRVHRRHRRKQRIRCAHVYAATPRGLASSSIPRPTPRRAVLRASAQPRAARPRGSSRPTRS